MRRNRYALFLWLLLLSLPATAQTKPDGGSDTLVGPVQAVRVESAAFGNDGGKVREGSRRPASILSFDTQGNLTEATYFERGNDFTQKQVMSYNEAGVKTEESTYEEKNKLSTRKVFISDGSGRLAEVDAYNDKGKVEDKIFYTYDAAGKMAEKRRQEKGVWESVIKYTYNPDGRIAEQDSYDDKDHLILKMFYSYTADGTRVESLSYEGQRIAHKVVRIYNAETHVTSFIFYRADGTKAWQRDFTDDGKGNLLIGEYKDADSYAKWEYNYDFDATGNWTRRTKSRWYVVAEKPTAMPIETLYRSITYYPQAYTRPQTSPSDTDELSTHYTPSGVLQGEALRRVQPSYPAAAKRDRVSGLVIVEVTVDEEGKVTHTRMVSGPPVFSDVAKSAASMWRFMPTLLNGVPAKVIGTISFNFTL